MVSLVTQCPLVGIPRETSQTSVPGRAGQFLTAGRSRRLSDLMAPFTIRKCRPSEPVFFEGDLF